MASLTSVKESSSAVTASMPSCAFGELTPPRLLHASRRSSASKVGSRAALRRALAASFWRIWASVAASVWRKETVLARCSRVSSSVSILSASETARSSWERVSLRCCHSLSMPWHVTRRFLRNSTSTERCLRVASRSSLASESAFWFEACSDSIASSFSLAMEIWLLFAWDIAAKSSADFASSFCFWERSASNSSFIRLRTPKISPEALL
mmetsp:Transcript_53601/g.157814  ORF Transcript_53601/g.157814 Transcript_53601/m.157814 type:complete len:210 (+) Transcript_53601:306-935(+)